jgi:hypothetical protein
MLAELSAPKKMIFCLGMDVPIVGVMLRSMNNIHWPDLIIFWLFSFVFCILPTIAILWAFGWFGDDQNDSFGE